MAKSKWFLLLVTEIFSALSLVALIVSFSTDYWVTSEIAYVGNLTLRNSHVNYGLFDGTMKRMILESTYYYDLSITCKHDINKCFYSCHHSTEKRHEEFTKLLNGENLDGCPESKKRALNIRMTMKENNFNEQVNLNESDDDFIDVVKTLEAASYEDEFLNAALWLTTVVFLALSSIFALLSAFFSMINILCNPIRLLTSAFGLYIWNGIAASLCALTMIIHSSFYMIYISKNIAVADTLLIAANYSSNGLAQLGVSFWILLVPIFCHLINIGLVYYRNYLLQREPKAPVISVSKNKSTILVY